MSEAEKAAPSAGSRKKVKEQDRAYKLRDGISAPPSYFFVTNLEGLMKHQMDVFSHRLKDVEDKAGVVYPQKLSSLTTTSKDDAEFLRLFLDEEAVDLSPFCDQLNFACAKSPNDVGLLVRLIDLLLVTRRVNEAAECVAKYNFEHDLYEQDIIGRDTKSVLEAAMKANKSSGRRANILNALALILCSTQDLVQFGTHMLASSCELFWDAMLIAKALSGTKGVAYEGVERLWKRSIAQSGGMEWIHLTLLLATGDLQTVADRCSSFSDKSKGHLVIAYRTQATLLPSEQSEMQDMSTHATIYNMKAILAQLIMKKEYETANAVAEDLAGRMGSTCGFPNDIYKESILAVSNFCDVFLREVSNDKNISMLVQIVREQARHDPKGFIPELIKYWKRENKLFAEMKQDDPTRTLYCNWFCVVSNELRVHFSNAKNNAYVAAVDVCQTIVRQCFGEETEKVKMSDLLKSLDPYTFNSIRDMALSAYIEDDGGELPPKIPVRPFAHERNASVSSTSSTPMPLGGGRSRRDSNNLPRAGYPHGNEPSNWRAQMRPNNHAHDVPPTRPESIMGGPIVEPVAGRTSESAPHIGQATKEQHESRRMHDDGPREHGRGSVSISNEEGNVYRQALMDSPRSDNGKHYGCPPGYGFMKGPLFSHDFSNANFPVGYHPPHAGVPLADIEKAPPLKAEKMRQLFIQHCKVKEMATSRGRVEKQSNSDVRLANHSTIPETQPDAPVQKTLAATSATRSAEGRPQQQRQEMLAHDAALRAQTFSQQQPCIDAPKQQLEVVLPEAHPNQQLRGQISSLAGYHTQVSFQSVLSSSQGHMNGPMQHQDIVAPPQDNSSIQPSLNLQATAAAEQHDPDTLTTRTLEKHTSLQAVPPLCQETLKDDSPKETSETLKQQSSEQHQRPEQTLLCQNQSTLTPPQKVPDLDVASNPVDSRKSSEEDTIEKNYGSPQDVHRTTTYGEILMSMDVRKEDVSKKEELESAEYRSTLLHSETTNDGPLEAVGAHVQPDTHCHSTEPQFFPNVVTQEKTNEIVTKDANDLASHVHETSSACSVNSEENKLIKEKAIPNDLIPQESVPIVAESEKEPMCDPPIEKTSRDGINYRYSPPRPTTAVRIPTRTDSERPSDEEFSAPAKPEPTPMQFESLPVCAQTTNEVLPEENKPKTKNPNFLSNLIDSLSLDSEKATSELSVTDQRDDARSTSVEHIEQATVVDVERVSSTELLTAKECLEPTTAPVVIPGNEQTVQSESKKTDGVAPSSLLSWPSSQEEFGDFQKELPKTAQQHAPEEILAERPKQIARSLWEEEDEEEQASHKEASSAHSMQGVPHHQAPVQRQQNHWTSQPKTFTNSNMHPQFLQPEMAGQRHDATQQQNAPQLGFGVSEHTSHHGSHEFGGQHSKDAHSRPLQGFGPPGAGYGNQEQRTQEGKVFREQMRRKPPGVDSNTQGFGSQSTNKWKSSDSWKDERSGLATSNHTSGNAAGEFASARRGGRGGYDESRSRSGHTLSSDSNRGQSYHGSGYRGGKGNNWRGDKNEFQS